MVFRIPFVILTGALTAGQPIERVIVNVNGTILTQTELERRQIAVLRQSTNSPPTAEALRSDPAFRAALHPLTSRILADAIDEILLLQRAQELGVTASEAQIASVLDAFKKENGIVTDADFRAVLDDAQLGEAELRRSLERQIVIRGVQEADVFGRVQVSEAQARAHYEREKGSLATPAAVLFRELAVTLAGGESTDGYTDGLIRFVRARDRLLAGEDFDAVARELSDAPSKTAGGLVGPVDPRELPVAIRESLRALAPGAISEPIRTEAGYVVLKMERARPAAPRSFVEARPAILARLLDEQRRVALDVYMRRLRGRAVIEWKDAVLKQVYESLAMAPAADRH